MIPQKNLSYLFRFGIKELLHIWIYLIIYKFFLFLHFISFFLIVTDLFPLFFYKSKLFNILSLTNFKLLWT